MTPPKLLILGAHQDDAEFYAGALMIRYRERGWPVKAVSVTNGESGHHTDFGPGMAARRAKEFAASMAIIGAEAESWENRDGYLTPSLDVRLQIIRAIREYQPDLVLTHRTIDYHPDHRAVALAVQDAAYLVTVPAVLPEVPHLRRDPVIAFMADRFTRPAPFRADVVIDAESALPTITDMVAQHESQVFEWLVYNHQFDPPPSEAAARREWLYKHHIEGRWRERADRLRPDMMPLYGAETAEEIRYAEGFEIAEHGSPLTDEQRERLFPGE
ncbi:PIG-L deacetylase family protein [Cerasicoccus fimbriatus]|uniref:PIG-L deacetylase family protein n=1 Tax=Cerasicoccus fimbriatus TaxID=3014554 RepID=UPI0022B46996|nr:PIG-L family deacetylase [Cerasicoccus sp. TK19100]